MGTRDAGYAPPEYIIEDITHLASGKSYTQLAAWNPGNQSFASRARYVGSHVSVWLPTSPSFVIIAELDNDGLATGRCLRTSLVKEAIFHEDEDGNVECLEIDTANSRYLLRPCGPIVKEDVYAL